MHCVSFQNRFHQDQSVECKFRGGIWRRGQVVSVNPFKVQPDGWSEADYYEDVREVAPVTLADEVENKQKSN